MKPEVYYDNKNNHIAWKGQHIGNELYSVVNINSHVRMNGLKNHVLDFIGLAPDLTDGWTDATWVSTYKYVYNRLSNTIRDIKNKNDYNNDSKLRELAQIATALKTARNSIYWIK